MGAIPLSGRRLPVHRRPRGQENDDGVNNLELLPISSVEPTVYNYRERNA
jgi:hypothetical protein